MAEDLLIVDQDHGSSCLVSSGSNGSLSDLRFETEELKSDSWLNQ